MSFTYGGVSTDNLDGVEVSAPTYPSAGGLTLDTVELPGKNGRFYGGSRQTTTQLTYDVTITGETPDVAEERKAEFMRHVDPSKGPRSLVLDTQSQWHYVQVVLAAEIAWEKFPFGPGRKVIYRGDVTFETNRDAAMREIDPVSVEASQSGVSYTHDIGNTASYPVLTAQSSSSSGTDGMVFGIGSFEITIDGTIPSDHTVELDWDRMQFYRLNTSGERVESLVPRMSTYERPQLMQGQTYVITRSSYTVPTTFYPMGRLL